MKRLFLILILFWASTTLAVQPVREPRFAQAGTFYQPEWRFCPGTADICFGHGTCPIDYGVWTSYLDAVRYQCETGGAAIKIRMLTPSDGTNSGTVRMGIYSDNAGLPDALLWEGTDQPYVAGAWIEEAVSGVTLEAEVWYWPAFKVSEASAEICYVPDGPSKSHWYVSSQDYVSSFIDPWSGGFPLTSQYSIQLCVAGGVADTYSGKFPRGIGRGIIR